MDIQKISIRFPMRFGRLQHGSLEHCHEAQSRLKSATTPLPMFVSVLGGGQLRCNISQLARRPLSPGLTRFKLTFRGQ